LAAANAKQSFTRSIIFKEPPIQWMDALSYCAMALFSLALCGKNNRNHWFNQNHS
jgi:hypothetical protein